VEIIFEVSRHLNRQAVSGMVEAGIFVLKSRLRRLLKLSELPADWDLTMD